MKMNVRLFGNMGCDCRGQVNASLVERCGKDDGLVASGVFVSVDNPGSGLGRLLLSDASDLKRSR
jgi:hypothetical protein